MTHHLAAQELRTVFSALPELAHYKTYTTEPLICDIRVLRPLLDTSPISEQQIALLSTLRGSYARYGSVPAIDEYDAKSCTYIGMVHSVCTCGRAEKHNAVEWHSIRFIPAAGKPDGTDDFALCVVKTGNLNTLLQSTLFSKRPGYEKHLVSITRICATPRYCLLDSTELSHRVGTAANFWLMNKAFYGTYAEQGFTYMTGLFRNDLTTRLLVDASKSPETIFTPAHTVLGLPPDAITINRGLAGYRWPAYFLNTNDLVRTLTELAQAGKVSKAFVDTAVADGFQNFGGTLQAMGPIPHTSVTGEELRSIVNAQVADGPLLRLFPLPTWQKTIEQQVAALHAQAVAPVSI